MKQSKPSFLPSTRSGKHKLQVDDEKLKRYDEQRKVYDEDRKRYDEERRIRDEKHRAYFEEIEACKEELKERLVAIQELIERLDTLEHDMHFPNMATMALTGRRLPRPVRKTHGRSDL